MDCCFVTDAIIIFIYHQLDFLVLIFVLIYNFFLTFTVALTFIQALIIFVNSILDLSLYYFLATSNMLTNW